MVTLDKYEYEPLTFTPTWDDEFKKFPYKRQPFGDFDQLAKWHRLGFTHKNFTGEMCPDQSITPDWAKNIGKVLGWNDCGYTFYRMQVGDILPPHADHFNKYKDKRMFAQLENFKDLEVFNNQRWFYKGLYILETIQEEQDETIQLIKEGKGNYESISN